MKTAPYGRLLFAASALLFGIITLLWRDADTWQNDTLRLGAVIGACISVAQIVGGVALAFARTARFAAIVLGIVYAIFTLACIPAIVAKPGVYVEYGNFFQWFSLVCGAIAAYAIAEPNAGTAITLGRIARLGLGICTVSFMLAQIVYLHFTATLVPTWIPPNQVFWTDLTTVAFGLAAVAILLNIRARLALRLTALMLTLFGLLVWVPHLFGHPELHGNWLLIRAQFYDRRVGLGRLGSSPVNLTETPAHEAERGESINLGSGGRDTWRWPPKHKSKKRFSSVKVSGSSSSFSSRSEKRCPPTSTQSWRPSAGKSPTGRTHVSRSTACWSKV